MNVLFHWIDHRLPIFSFVKNNFVDYKTPKNLNYLWTFGSLASITLVILMMSGIFLAMHYDPNPQFAFSSIERIMRDVNFGWLIRYIHMNGASMLFILVYLHIFRSLYYGSYKAPRELLWILGVIIFFIMMATAFMGYVLPWGQMSFWGATVITNLFTAIPIVGEDLLHWLLGGFSVGAPTLNRFFALHYFLPFIIVVFVLLHLWALHKHGSNNPLGIDVKQPKDEIPFHPYYTAKDLLSLVIFLTFFSCVVFFFPNFFGEPENYIPANPLVTPPHIVPEWYFLPFYAILRVIPDKLFGVLFMFGSIALLFFMPWLDGAKVRSLTFRPIYRALFWSFVIDTLILGWVGSAPLEGNYIVIGAIATAYYFSFFLVLVPFVSRWEKPRMVPESISAHWDSVQKKKKKK